MKFTTIMLILVAALVSVMPSVAQENFTINITSPENKDDVEWRTWVEGETNLTEDYGYNIYVIINPADSSTWWVQPKAVLDDGEWDAYVYFGREGMDEGTWQRVCAIITTSELEDTTFDDIPENVAKSEIIRVRRI